MLITLNNFTDSLLKYWCFSVAPNMKDFEIVIALKTNKVLLKEDTRTKICQNIKNKIVLDKVFTFYSLAKP